MLCVYEWIWENLKYCLIKVWDLESFGKIILFNFDDEFLVWYGVLLIFDNIFMCLYLVYMYLVIFEISYFFFKKFICYIM